MELSPLLGSIPKVNVFKAPNGYFDTLSLELLLARSDRSSLTGFTSVPEGYFENLPSILLNKIKADEVFEETKQISSTIAEIGNSNVFSAPAGYFNELPATILNTACAANDKDFEEQSAIFSKANVFSTPAGYFDNLSANILAKIKHEPLKEVVAETAAISSVVAGIGTKNVYSVPANYFEWLTGEVLQHTSAARQAKVVTMKPRLGVFKYAVAAAITGILGFSLFFMLNKKDQQPGTNQATMAAAQKIIKTNSFEAELNSIPDAAIVNFLEGKGEDVEAALVASLADENDLPEATDYLINDNTLDEILKTVELSN